MELCHLNCRLCMITGVAPSNSQLSLTQCCFSLGEHRKATLWEAGLWLHIASFPEIWTCGILLGKRKNKKRRNWRGGKNIPLWKEIEGNVLKQESTSLPSPQAFITYRSKTDQYFDIISKIQSSCISENWHSIIGGESSPALVPLSSTG